METCSEIMEDMRSEWESAPPKCTAPRLLLQQGDDEFEEQIFHVLSPLASHDYYETKCIPELSGNSIIGCRYGWLLLVDIYEGTEQLCLLNLFTLDTILLPALEAETEGSRLWFTLTAPPDDLNCLVLLFDENQAIFCRPRRDDQWTVQKTQLEGSGEEIVICDPTSCNGVIYATGDLENRSQLVTIEVADGEIPGQLLMTIRYLVLPPPFAQKHMLRRNTFLVESCGKLFAVSYHFNLQDIDHVEIYRLDTDNDGSSTIWTEVTNLKSCAFFIGYNCSASMWLKSHEPVGLLRENSIYITCEGDEGFYRYGLEDRSLTPFLPCPNLPEEVSSRHFWAVPLSQSGSLDKTLGEEEHDYCITSIDKGIIQSRVMQCTCLLQNDAEDDECGTIKSVFSALPLDIISLIASRLSLSDYLRFRVVCKRFLKAAPRIDWITTSIMSNIKDHTDFTPSLLFLDRTDGMLCNLVNLSSRGCDLCWSSTGPDFLKRATITFSSKGWLLRLSEDGILHSFNPVSNTVVEYPETWVQGVTWGFSTFPTSPDCIIVGLDTLSFEFIYIHHGDEDWSYYRPFNEGAEVESYDKAYKTPIFYEGAFYYLDSNDILGAFELTENGCSWTIVIGESPCGEETSEENYLVECDGMLLSIFVGDFGQGVLIFRLHRSTMTWENVQSLGKHMLFLGPVSSFSRPATCAGMENRIYFLRFLGGSALYYSLVTGDYHSDGAEHPVDNFYNSRQLLQSCWIQPTQP